MRRAPAGTEVGLYVDLVARVEVGDVIQTESGRRYVVELVRVQARGKHAGRQHLRAVVVPEGAQTAGRVHVIRWYKRKKKSHARPA